MTVLTLNYAGDPILVTPNRKDILAGICICVFLLHILCIHNDLISHLVPLIGCVGSSMIDILHKLRLFPDPKKPYIITDKNIVITFEQIMQIYCSSRFKILRNTHTQPLIKKYQLAKINNLVLIIFSVLH